MQIHRSIESFRPAHERGTVVTLGTFDGVHIGHQRIIERLTERAATEDCESLILTFFPHPRMVLQDASEIKLLNTLEEKISLLEKTRLDHLVIHPFNDAFSRLDAEAFVSEILVDRFKIKKIIIGHDHRFGRNRTATYEDLIIYGEKYDFGVEQISAQEINNISVSSTKIRAALSEGDIGLANSYLGNPYPLTGIVEMGKQLGRTIGFPTANLNIRENYKLIPKKGVYVVEAVLEGENLKGMMNIGTNPTFDGKGLSVEAHFFNFDKSIYGKKLRISILHRIRDEVKFGSVDLLKQALATDMATSLSWFTENAGL